MQLRYCGNASPILVSPAARGQPWAHGPQAMLGCGSVPSWPHRLLAGAGEVQALRHSDLFHLFPQPVISIAARVCNYPQLFMAGAWSWWDDPPAGSQRDPQARTPLWSPVKPRGCIPTGGKRGLPSFLVFPGAPWNHGTGHQGQEGNEVGITGSDQGMEEWG